MNPILVEHFKSLAIKAGKSITTDPDGIIIYNFFRRPYISFNPNGCVFFYTHPNMHRHYHNSNGPAVIDLSSKFYYIEGDSLTEEEYWKHPKVNKQYKDYWCNMSPILTL